jgi:plastocyanin
MLTLGVVGIIALIIPILVGYFLVTGMASNSSYTFPGGATLTAASTSAGPGSTVSVSIPSGAANPANPPGYAPDTITVVLGVNASVTWTNADTAPHTVSSSSVPSGASPFDSGNMSPGATYSYTFTVPGTYQYKCNYHSWMTGTVTVVSG